MIECAIDLPRSIVWDALVDPVLVEGWLHPTAQLVGAHLRERRDPELLESDVPELGPVRFELAVVAGGTRGTSTHVRAHVPADRVAEWAARLDALPGLLRGHPVDWNAAGEAAPPTSAKAARR